MRASQVLVRRTTLRGVLLSRGVRIAARRLLARLHSADELSVLLTDDSGIRDLNRRHRLIDRATDVLSFPQHEADELTPPVAPDRATPALLGDVVISLQTARRMKGCGSLVAEVRRLLVHGTLHLFGYDHDDPPRDDEPMLELQEQLLIELATTR